MPLPLPSRRSQPDSPGSSIMTDNNSFYITSGGGNVSMDSFNANPSNKPKPTLRTKESSNNMREDTTYGGHMLRLHRSLHAANTKLINSLSSPNPPTTPFTATFGYSGDLVTASTLPVAGVISARAGNAAQTRSRLDSVADVSDQGSTPQANGAQGDVSHTRRDKEKTNASIESALAMGRLAKRLEKLSDVDEVVQQALRHRDRIAKYGRIAAVFKNIASTSDKTVQKGSQSTDNFIPDINIDGYDPSSAT